MTTYVIFVVENTRMGIVVSFFDTIVVTKIIIMLIIVTFIYDFFTLV